MLTKEQTFVLKTYCATRLYCRKKAAFHTEFSISVTMLSDSSILRLVRKFKEAGREAFRINCGRQNRTQQRLQSVSRKYASWSHRIFLAFVVTILCKYTDFVQFSEFHLRDLCSLCSISASI